ncbi:MAG TPA: hypothetical protein VFG69_12020 [Nannocystaceae bacterium]|nr:hypothetical protein [Nannocystaceae bacterium]
MPAFPLMVALASCHRHADTVDPVAAPPAPTAAAEPATPAATEPAPEVDCSSATIEAVSEGRSTWTDEGNVCLPELQARCERGEGEACIDATAIVLEGLGGVAADPPRAVAFVVGACGNGIAKACLSAAVLHERGIGTAADEAAALALLVRACELGDAEGCKASEARAPKKAASLVPNANVNVESLAADGLELRELACAMESMPLFGTIAIAASLAKQKRAIDRCAPKGQAFAVTWTFIGGKVKDVAAVGGSDAANKCVAKAVARSAAPLEGRCGAVILAGDAAKAATTIEALRSATP